MRTLARVSPILAILRSSEIRYGSVINLTIGASALNFPLTSRRTWLSMRQRSFTCIRRCHSYSDPQNDELEGFVQDLRVPNHWLNHSKASEESEWLRITLHKWLDDEYCPEETNVEISKVAAWSYYTSLVEKQTDLGEILLKMVGALETISYQESFHGAFSAANAAVNLIIQRIEKN